MSAFCEFPCCSDSLGYVAAGCWDPPFHHIPRPLRSVCGESGRALGRAGARCPGRRLALPPPGEAPDRLALRGPPAGLQVWKEKRVRVGRAQSGLGDPTVSAPLTLAVPHGDSAEPPSLWPGETRCFQPGPWSSGFYLEMQVFLNRQAAHYSVSDHGTVVALWRGSGLMVTPTHSLLAWPRCRVPTGTAGHVALPGRATKVSTAADRAPFDTSLPQAGTPVDAW